MKVWAFVDTVNGNVILKSEQWVAQHAPGLYYPGVFYTVDSVTLMFAGIFWLTAQQ